mmetsp:Transcript_11347/g.19412  ORF Transcript_11347/g.19412 Transcript_11347/m.19412 type:complete len:180 (+) Transcript_11347:68-607(+)
MPPRLFMVRSPMLLRLPFRVASASKQFSSAKSPVLPPGAIVFGMPRISPSFTGGQITHWYVDEGSDITPYTLLFDIHTDSVLGEGYKDPNISHMTMQIECVDHARLVKKFAGCKGRSENEDIKVGMAVALLCDDDKYLEEVRKVGVEQAQDALDSGLTMNLHWQAYNKTGGTGLECSHD